MNLGADPLEFVSCISYSSFESFDDGENLEGPEKNDDPCLFFEEIPC